MSDVLRPAREPLSPAERIALQLDNLADLARVLRLDLSAEERTEYEECVANAERCLDEARAELVVAAPARSRALAAQVSR